MEQSNFKNLKRIESLGESFSQFQIHITQRIFKCNNFFYKNQGMYAIKYGQLKFKIECL